MSGKQKFTVVFLAEREGISREEIENSLNSKNTDAMTRIFIVAAPLDAVVLTMNQPLVAVEALARMARRGDNRLSEGILTERSWAGDSRRFTSKRR